MYEIHPNVPTKVAYIGYWSDRMGLRIKETKKWERRRDMEVIYDILMAIFINNCISMSWPEIFHFSL